RAQVAFSARLEHILVHGRDNLPDRGRSGVGAATVHKTERSSQLNENGSLLRKKRRSTSLVPADAGMDHDIDTYLPPATARPRRRGDGPLYATGRGNATNSSPQTRGWTEWRRG